MIELAPTIYEVIGVEAPTANTAMKGVAQQPIEGTSLTYSFAPEASDAQNVAEGHLVHDHNAFTKHTAAAFATQ